MRRVTLAVAVLIMMLPTLTRAQKAPDPEIIGLDTISTPDDEFGGSLSPDGKDIYFDITVPAHYLYTMCESHFVDGKWTKPEVMSISGQYRDSDPVLSPDGQTLFFASDRPVKGVDTHRFLIWTSKKTSRGWATPQLMDGPVNSAGSQVFASIANNGNLYFTSSRKSDAYDIFVSRLVNGKYQEAEDIAILNDPNISSLEAFIAPDESYLLIGSFGRPGGLGNSDLFISYNQNGVWSKAINLGPVINTSAREYSPRVSPDRKWLYFSSERLLPESTKLERFTYADFVRVARSTFNGLGNIYRIPMEYVFDVTRPK